MLAAAEPFTNERRIASAQDAERHEKKPLNENGAGSTKRDSIISHRGKKTNEKENNMKIAIYQIEAVRDMDGIRFMGLDARKHTRRWPKTDSVNGRKARNTLIG